MSNELTKGDRENILRNELLRIKRVSTEHFFRIGEILKEIRDEELWKECGYTDFQSYYADPELGLKKSSVYHSISLVEKFPRWRSLIDIPVSKLIRVAPYVSESNKEEMLSLARGLSRSDLRKELVDQGFLPQLKSRKEVERTVRICETCGGLKVEFHWLCNCGLNQKQIDYISELIEKIKDKEYEV